jgi:hypothetical protein
MQRKRNKNPNYTRPIYEGKVTFTETKYNVPERKYDLYFLAGQRAHYWDPAYDLFTHAKS